MRATHREREDTIKKLLIISYHFPPDSAIGAVRPAKFAKHLPEFGWTPVIYTVNEACYDSCDWSKFEEHLKKIEIYRTKPFPGPLQLYSRLRRKKAGSGEPKTGAEAREISRHTAPMKLISSLLRLPDVHQGWILDIAMQGRRILRRRGINVFMTSGPPMSTHLGGLLLKMTTGARWIADFRDPWTSMLEWDDNTFRSDLVNRIDRRLERMVVKTADAVVCTAPSVTRYFQTLLSDGQKKKVVTITNGFDSADFEHATSRETDSRKLRICHAGSLYLGRNPEPLFRALSALMARGAVGRDEIEVEFIGNQDYNGRSLSTLVEGHGLSGTVVLTGKMPFDKCFERLMQSHALLLFAQGQPQAIPGKVFEYLRMNKPILAIIDEGDTKDLLRSSHNCFVANPHEVREVEEKLLKVINTVRENGNQEVSIDHIEQYERRNLTRRLASLLTTENNHCRPAGGSIGGGRDG